MKQSSSSGSKPVASQNWMANVDDLLANGPSSEFELNDDDSDDDYDDETETECDFSEAAYASSSELKHVVKETPKVGSSASVVKQGPSVKQEQSPITATSVQTTLRVPVAAKKSGGGIFISNAMRHFLTRNHSDGDLQSLQQSRANDPLQKLLYRSESAEKISVKDDHSRMVIVEPRSNKTLQDTYFLQVTPKMITSYDVALMTAVRTNDLDTIQNYHAAGRNLQCCNRFHESILHTAARRGCTEVMEFLIFKAKLDLKVVCDSGRTPLHDSAWTSQPNFTIVRWILELCPDFLLISDNKNFTPLDYIPKELHQEWCDFLTEHQTLLKPHVVIE
jgi:hypothetical protein